MRISALTLFPEIYDCLKTGIIGKALNNGAFSLNVVNIRDFSADKHKRCDDAPYGGGAGMVMTPQPLFDAINAIDPEHKAKRIYLSPKGQVLNQKLVTLLASEQEILLINGSYEGIDQRIIDLCVDTELSVGDYVLTSGDFASLIIIDSVARYIPDVLGSDESTAEESFSNGMLEYPHYTRPQTFMGLSVPEVLLSGNHAEIAAWRLKESQNITKTRRPDLISNN